MRSRGVLHSCKDTKTSGVLGVLLGGLSYGCIQSIQPYVMQHFSLCDEGDLVAQAYLYKNYNYSVTFRLGACRMAISRLCSSSLYVTERGLFGWRKIVLSLVVVFLFCLQGLLWLSLKHLQAALSFTKTEPPDICVRGTRDKGKEQDSAGLVCLSLLETLLTSHLLLLVRSGGGLLPLHVGILLVGPRKIQDQSELRKATPHLDNRLRHRSRQIDMMCSLQAGS